MLRNMLYIKPMINKNSTLTFDTFHTCKWFEGCELLYHSLPFVQLHPRRSTMHPPERRKCPMWSEYSWISNRSKYYAAQLWMLRKSWWRSSVKSPKTIVPAAGPWCRAQKCPAPAPLAPKWCNRLPTAAESSNGCPSRRRPLWWRFVCWWSSTDGTSAWISKLLPNFSHRL